MMYQTERSVDQQCERDLIEGNCRGGVLGIEGKISNILVAGSPQQDLLSGLRAVSPPASTSLAI
jgi:hypothetical protein